MAADADSKVVLHLRFLPGGDEDQRLKKALKALKRYWGLVCVKIEDRRTGNGAIPGLDPAAAQEAVNSLDRGEAIPHAEVFERLRARGPAPDKEVRP